MHSPRVLAVALAFLAACSAKPAPPKVLFIGVDGATWDIVTPMIERGELPNLKALVERGFASPLETIQPSLSPIIWTSIATGKTMQKHGITGFTLTQPNGKEEPALSNERKVRAIWELLGENDVRVGVVGWWLTWPAETVYGFMVSSLSVLEAGLWKGSVYEGLPKQVFPPAWSKDLDAMVRAEQAQAAATCKSLFGDLDPKYGDKIQQRVILDTKSALLSDAIFSAAAKQFLARDPVSFAAVYFGIVDVSSHRFWKYYRPREGRWRLADDDVARLGDVVPAAYRWVDARIGELVAQAGPDTLVIVASDHGFHAETREGMSDDERSGGHERALLAGVLIAAGPGVRHADLRADEKAKLPTIYDLTPTLLYVYGLARADDMDGAVYTDLFEPAFLAAHPAAAPIATYETSPRPTTTLTKSDLEAVGNAKQGILARFQSLGYLDSVKPSDPVKPPGSDKPADEDK